MAKNKESNESDDVAVYLGYIEDNDKIESEIHEEECPENEPCTSTADQAQVPWLINKIGGLPIYPYVSNSLYLQELEASLTHMQCRHCKSSCVLIFQITSPIDDSPIDRVVQIFTCVKSDCIKHSWFSLRCMLKSQKEATKKSNEESFKSDLLEVMTDSNYGKVLVCKQKAFFKPYYLSVIEEPTGRENFARNNLEALKLASKFIDLDAKPAPIEEKYKNLKNYKPPLQPAHLSDLDDFEKFQLEKLYNNDKVMYRFYKRVNRYPSQVVRYEWEGEPLINSSKVKIDVQNCPSCSSKRKFELQLMSALLNYLMTEKEFDRESHDFSSVIIHSCSKNCSTKTFNLEDTYFMPDPDSRIFNKVKQRILSLKLKEEGDDELPLDPTNETEEVAKLNSSEGRNSNSKGKKKKKKKKKTKT